jgi:6 kDa early secretory antigenic target
MGDLGNLKVGYEALDSMAAGILNAAAAMDEKLNAMERRMDGRKAEWSGDDSNAYDAARAGWDRAMAEMMTVLQDIARAVNLSREKYQATEAGNARRFG